MKVLYLLPGYRVGVLESQLNECYQNNDNASTSSVAVVGNRAAESMELSVNFVHVSGPSVCRSIA